MNAWYLCRAEWNLLFCFFNFQLAYFPPSALLAFCRTAGQTLYLWLLWSTLAAFLFVCLLQGLLQPKAELFNLGTADVLGSLNLCCWRQSCELQNILVASLALLLCGQQHTPSLLSAVTTKTLSRHTRYVPWRQNYFCLFCLSSVWGTLASCIYCFPCLLSVLLKFVDASCVVSSASFSLSPCWSLVVLHSFAPVLDGVLWDQRKNVWLTVVFQQR